ncbi:ATP-binding protein [Streptomyces sp. NBC_01381]|uniref:ATP-binding protein n=1 Tax=Streptomyces sp. NBC_01381 TaxID=2903845 RepID=UPI0022516F0F|nr:ATP-binding protein [Streptomyces sp. NBC_01381]MCX4671507.1 ATP-binding protein [Streptomyces sp. NBC_01381]
MPTNATPQVPVTVRMFTQRLSSTPRGARLARHLVAHRLDAWGYPYASEANETVTLIAAELAANAVRHGRVPGRDFRIRLFEAGDRTVRVEVTDQRGERLPVVADVTADGEGGRGLLLVAALAERWGVERGSGGSGGAGRGPAKTVWAEVAVGSG